MEYITRTYFTVDFELNSRIDHPKLFTLVEIDQDDTWLEDHQDNYHCAEWPEAEFTARYRFDSYNQARSAGLSCINLRTMLASEEGYTVSGHELIVTERTHTIPADDDIPF